MGIDRRTLQDFSIAFAFFGVIAYLLVVNIYPPFIYETIWQGDAGVTRVRTAGVALVVCIVATLSALAAYLLKTRS